MKKKQPKGKLRLVRDILGTEVFKDEEGKEFMAEFKPGKKAKLVRI